MHRYLIINLELYCALASKKKSLPNWHLFITEIEMKWTKWYAMTLHVIAYQSLELLFGMHTFHFNCFFEDFNCAFTQIRCLSRVLLEVYDSKVLHCTMATHIHDTIKVINLEIKCKCKDYSMFLILANIPSPPTYSLYSIKPHSN